MYYKRLKFCIIYLALNRGYFEAVLMKNTPRTLGVNVSQGLIEFVCSEWELRLLFQN
jgi:hypothetical protein